VTVKVSAASAEGAAAARAEPAAGADLAAGAGPAAGGRAEHPSAATIHKNAAQMTGAFVSIWRALAWLEHPMAAGVLIRPGP
jgi:hypothetical protein